MENNEEQQLQLAIAQPFKLPPRWRVKKVPRPDGLRVDRYFIEPVTGKKFRSLNEVERHVNGEDQNYKRTTRKTPNTNRKKKYHHHQSYGYEGSSYESKVNKMIESGQSNMAIVAYGDRAASAEPFTLPDGWYVEEVPRRVHPQRKKCKWIDKYYHEIATGRKFRSMVAVQRYLAEMDEDAPSSEDAEQIEENKPMAKVFGLESRYKDCTPKQKNVAGKSKQESSFNAPPMKVNWVLSSPDTWTPFVSETPVPDSVKDQWNSRFMMFMNDGIGKC